MPPQDNTGVAMLRFDMSAAGVGASAVQHATLGIHVLAAGSGFNRFLVLGVRGART